jgi:hypothetical protein
MRGKRREMPEGLIIAGDKAVGKKAARLAEIARAKRTRRVFSEEWGPVDPAAEKQTLYDYIDGMAG